MLEVEMEIKEYAYRFKSTKLARMSAEARGATGAHPLLPDDIQSHILEVTRCIISERCMKQVESVSSRFHTMCMSSVSGPSDMPSTDLQLPSELWM